MKATIVSILISNDSKSDKSPAEPTNRRVVPMQVYSQTKFAQVLHQDGDCRESVRLVLQGDVYVRATIDDSRARASPQMPYFKIEQLFNLRSDKVGELRLFQITSASERVLEQDGGQISRVDFHPLNAIIPTGFAVTITIIVSEDELDLFKRQAYNIPLGIE